MSSTRRPDSAQLVRQWALLRLLADSKREFTVKELADQLASTKTTIQRDLATLQQSFVVVEERIGKQKKTYRIDQKIGALSSVDFGTMELLAIHAASASLAGLATTPFHDDLLSVMRKLRGFLGPRHNGGLDRMAGVFQTHHRGFVTYDDHGDSIDDLVNAIAKRQFCQIRYYSPWKGTTRDHRLRPLKLMWNDSSLYLLALIEGKSDISTLSVQRIQELELSTETFPVPRVDVEAHARKAFGVWVSDDEEDVEILFSKEMGWRVEERIFHPDESKQRLEDGRLRYRLRTSAQWEIIPWVLSYGAHAELIAPLTWRESIKSTLENLSNRY